MDMVRALHEQYGSSVHSECATQVVDKLRNPGREVSPISVGDIRRGRFYYFFYDVAGKTTLMEKYSPVFVVDYRRIKNEVFVFGASMNFIPATVRVVFFDKVLGGFEDSLKESKSAESIGQEPPLASVDYEGAYRALSSIGFEYSIRRFDASLIDKVYEVSTSFVDKLVLMDTSRFTRVPEGKMVEIWAAKIKDQDKRRARIMKELYDDYNKMAETISNSLGDIADRAKTASKEADRLSKIARIR